MSLPYKPTIKQPEKPTNHLHLQVCGQFEVCSREPRNAFVNRERENPIMLRYPTPDDGDYRGKKNSKKVKKSTNINYHKLWSII